MLFPKKINVYPNPLYGKRWQMYILLQCLVNLTQPIDTQKAIYIFIHFLCCYYYYFYLFIFFGKIHPCTDIVAYARFKVFGTFLSKFNGFHTLRIMSKCTSHHLFWYGGLIIAALLPKDLSWIVSEN